MFGNDKVVLDIPVLLRYLQLKHLLVQFADLCEIVEQSEIRGSWLDCH